MKTFVTYVSMADGVGKAPLTIQVRDTSCGTAVANVPIRLFQKRHLDDWEPLEEGWTNYEGSLSLKHMPKPDLLYKLYAQTSSYFEKINTKSPFPFIEVVFEISEVHPNILISLNISPFGYNICIGI